MERLALDTTFLIDLQNERRERGAERGALAFLKAHPEAELFLPAVALGEYLEGFDEPDGPEAVSLVAPLTILNVTAEVARVYAKVTRHLRKQGQLIGNGDLWIGCTALAAELPILTRNAKDFSRIPSLYVVGYRT
jgi:tRNA(fMet)-specific endonuclease VapC